MPMVTENVVLAAKAALSQIDYTGGETDNIEALEALIGAIIDEIITNAEVTVTGGSSAGVYKIT